MSLGFCFFVPFENVSSIWRRHQCRLFVYARDFDNCFVFLIHSQQIKNKTYLILQTKGFFLFYEQTFDTTEPLLPWLEVFFHHLKKIIFVFKILKYKNILQMSNAFLLFKLYMATPWNNNHCPG